jgi:hypothetical protein
MSSKVSARRDGRVDRRAVLLDALLAHLVDGDDQHLGRALEGVAEAGRVGEAARPHPYPPADQGLRLARVADADPDLVRGHPRQQPLDDPAAKLPGGSGHDDHGALQ